MSQKTEFEEAARDEQMSLFREFAAFMSENKKWWLLPIFLVLGMITLLTIFAATGAAPFIYTVF